MWKLISLLLITTACSSVAQKNKKVEQGPLHPTGAVIDLGRSAYLKGCVDALAPVTPRKISVFDSCKVMAREYAAELKQILETQPQKIQK